MVHRITTMRCAKLLGIHRAALTDWESGKHRPRPEMRERLRRLFGASVLLDELDALPYHTSRAGKLLERVTSAQRRLPLR